MLIQVGHWRFRPSLLPSVAFLLLLLLLLSLGQWQWSRAAEKQALIDDKQERRMAPALVVGEQQVEPQLDRFRPATATGRYVAGQQFLLDNRLYRGQAGYHVFSRFETDQGQQLLVNRGWVSVGASREFLPSLPLPQGRVELSGHLDSPESVGLILGEPPYTSIAELVLLQNLDVSVLAEARQIDLSPLTLVLDEGQPGALQFDWMPVEAISPEKHLGYAVQWYALAVALIIIFVGVNTRRDRPPGLSGGELGK